MKVIKGLVSWLLTGGVVAGAIAYNFNPTVHRQVNHLLASVGIPGAAERAGRRLYLRLNQSPARIGGYIDGHRISSNYGMRFHPTTGYERMHKGVDVAMPMGAPIYAPASADANATVRVSCWEDSGGGGIIAMISADLLPGSTIKLLHLSECYAGIKKGGELVGRIGSTGTSTGPHFHGEYITRFGKHAEPSVGLVSWLITGEVPESRETIAHTLFSENELRCAVGRSEGTLDQSCQPTEAYNGHPDPGNPNGDNRQNLGAFSYQHGASSPEEADRLQLAKLREAEQEIILRTEKAGVQLSKIEFYSVLDMFTQSEAAALGRDGLLDLIIEARTNAYIDPDSGQLDAPGFDNDRDRLEEDQRRRTEAIAEVLGEN